MAKNTATTEAPKVGGQMTLEEFKKAMLGGEFQDFGTVFNEQTQTTYTARVFNRLRFEPLIAKLLFVPLMLSFPFDPVSGEMSQDGFNMKKRFRPFVRPDHFLKTIKALCHEDETLKKRYMDYAGFSGVWDTKPTEEFTDADRAILFIYRRPMTATHPAVRINNTAITGEKYGGQYLLQTKQDPMTGEFIGEISNLHKLGLLASSLQRIEVNSFNTALAEQKSACISLDLGRSFITTKTFTDIKDADSNEAKTVRGQIRSSYPLGSVAPLLVTPMIGIDVQPQSGELTEFVPVDGEEKEQLLPQFRNPVSFEGSLLATDKYSVLDKITEIIGNAFPKDPSKKKERNVDADVYANFAVLEYITDSDVAKFENDTDRNMAAQKMEAKKERIPLYSRKRKAWRHEGLDVFMENMAAFYDFAQKDSFIQRMPEMLMSNYKAATEVIETRAMKVFSEQFNLGEEYKELFNQDILATHSPILMELWPEEFAEKVGDIVDQLEDGDAAFQELLEASESTDTPSNSEELELEVSAEEVPLA